MTNNLSTSESPDQLHSGVGQTMLGLMTELFGITRSITGEGVRQTLRRLQVDLPLHLHEIPSGMQVYDWQVPPEWNIRNAYIKAPDGEPIVDFCQNNLHVVSYSTPVHQKLSLQQLQPHLHSLPQHPAWIPYRTSYYKRNWGFCIAEQTRQRLREGDYEVFIDADLNPQGNLTYGELVLPGRSADEVLISCHICHPSLANDNLAALAVAHQLALRLSQSPRRYTYRFLFVPGTIGPIAWMSLNPGARERIRFGLVLALLGDRSPLTYKRSCHTTARIDQIVEEVLATSGCEHRIINFSPVGYDERQYGSAGTRLPVGRLSRAIEGEYPEYHSSADNLDLIDPCCLEQSLASLTAVVERLESDRVFKSHVLGGEAQLGKRGLYEKCSGETNSSQNLEALLWVQNRSCGLWGLRDISRESGLPIDLLEAAAGRLVEHQLIEEVDPVLLAPSLSNAADLDDAAASPSDEQEWNRLAHQCIPGGCHTYAKGDDQFPANAPCFFVRGYGCHVEDSEGRRFIEYGMGLRSVGLGHAYPDVVRAVKLQLELGSNFTRPSTLEVELARDFLALLPAAQMVKFAKNGSDATTAAVRVARAFTGREKIAFCADQPFFSVDDWFIASTPMSAGIPRSIRELNLPFRYNDLASVIQLFRDHPGEIACLIMEAATVNEPQGDFLQRVQELCQREGTLFILDEMITGFRWHVGGAQAEYGLQPDLSTFGKALGNGFSVAALAGRREIMELGGIKHDQPRVFLLSTTHGAETHCLAAARETLRVYRDQPVIETLYRRGRQLREGLNAIAANLAISENFEVIGRDCNLVFVTKDLQGQRSQELRTLLIQELTRRGIFAPSLVVSYSHGDHEIVATLNAFAEALEVFRNALRHGVSRYLIGSASKPVFRKYN